MLNIDGINIYTKTMITCDEDLAGQISGGREELNVRSIGHCAMLEEDAMHLGTKADVSAHVFDISGKKTQLRGLWVVGHGCHKGCDTNRDLEKNEIRQRQPD